LKNRAVINQIFISAVIAIISISIYHFCLSKRLVIVEQKAEAHQVNFDEFLYSDRSDQLFSEEYKSNFVEAASTSREAVVYILAYEKFDKSAFQNGYKREKGSGVIVHQDGYVVTNYHVIENATHIEITLNNRKEYLAEVIGIDPTTDLALLKIEASGLPYLVFGDSDNVNVGEWVLAVGNPFGLQSTVTAGIISAKARNIELAENQNNIESLIQSDVVINPGSSGGALIDEKGRLIGINTAIISASGMYDGISFAVPANVAKKVVFDLKQFGAVQRAKLGITLRDMDSHTADMMNLDDVRGILVEAVSFNGAAYEAGIKRGDIIIKINSKSVNTSPQFNEKITEFRPGDKITVSYLRNGQEYSRSITLRNHLNTTDFVAIQNNPRLKAIGIEIRNLNSEEKSRIDGNGIYVVSVDNGSIAAQSNIEPGYIIQEVNNRLIKNDREFIDLITKSNKSLEFNGFYERYPGEYPYILDFN